MGLQIRQSQVKFDTKKADIMFCIDNSRSMESCIQGVRNTVNAFVTDLESGAEGQSPVDWRIGLMSYSDEEYVFLDLSKETTRFRALLNREVVGDEFTPGAIDYTVSHTSWRPGAQHIIVLFTDEPLEEGRSRRNRDNGAAGFGDLLHKITCSHVQIIYYGPQCEYYRRFQLCPKSELNFMDSFNSVNFDRLMKRLAVTVSSGSSFENDVVAVKQMVYDLSDIKINWN